MVLAIALVAALAIWDVERESRAALEDFAQEQTTVATAIASALGEKLVGAPPAERPERMLSAVHTIERPGAVRVLVAGPDAGALRDVDGRAVAMPSLDEGIRQGASSVRLSRSEAVALGFPARTAIAGIARVEGTSEPWSVLVVTTARVERDRELRAGWRLGLGVLVASGLVLAFGGFAMKTQRKELELAHRLALSALQTKRDERLVRADKLATMGALATGIAHEVSTPLGVILGRAEQLLPRQPDERARRAVETIAAQTERIHAVVRGFLALARGSKPEMERTAPERLARAAIELVEHRFDKARVRLEHDAAGGLPEVACDPRLFEQVLVNLLLNACDACSEGGLVRLALGASAGRVTFSVTDDGVGIPPDAAERAVEPFFTTKPAGKGTGLGLAIASEIVKHHRGSLELRPRAGGSGTCAVAELPAASGADHA
jgi:signal transduction histidine kinase